MTSQTGLPTPTIEIAYAPEQIQRELEHWSANLTKAKADGNLLAIDTAQRYLDTWLDRSLAQRGR